ncbi:MAG: nucleotide sugar dehydrogenase [Myxococcota bacterium]
MEKVAVIGLGYVGLPVAVAFGRHGAVVGVDIDEARVRDLRDGVDHTKEVSPEALAATDLRYTTKIEDAAECTIFVVTVPTPIDGNRNPDLSPLRSASRSVGKVLKAGDLVIFESTVYPGVTEDVCAPILSDVSGLARSAFSVGYSPERINPGDTVHRLETITKVVSGDTAESLERVASLYATVVEAGVHRAPSVRVAEAAKVIENTQRDVNIALMNELALIFERMGIRTTDVLAAAGTKWNFLPFTPGLVGGHCIGVDPYYLTAKAESLGYHPQVILSGRRINDGMGAFVAQKLVKMLIAAQKPVKGARVLIVGLTFKENVPDLRNSRVPDILRELEDFGVDADVFDPVATPAAAKEECNVELVTPKGTYDGVILAVPHSAVDASQLFEVVAEGGVFVDVKSAVPTKGIPPHISHWAL